MKKMIVCLTALLLALPMLATAVAAADDWTVSVRIVGLGEDIYNAEVSVAEGASAGDALAAVEGVEIVGLDSYITEVDGIAAGMFGGWDGWNYRVNGKSPSVGINDYALADGDAVLLYYGMFDMQIPEVAYADGVLTFTSTDTTYDDGGNPTEQVNPIVGATVRWDDAVYTTDENGQVTVDEALRTAGEHAASIEKKAENEPVDGKYLYAVLPLESGFTVTVAAADVSDDLSEASPSEAESAAPESSAAQTPDTGDGLLAYTAVAALLVLSLAMLRVTVRKTK